ncbi:MAG: DUF4010 domain-containing protein, partial [Aeromicrobium sp.]|nr:DUF4010 domain-containing protein [Burkholderiales bacterium]
AIGYIATRAMGPRYGLALAGFAGGFISSTAAIHSMSVRASLHPALRDAATAGAVLSSVATFIQLGLIVAVVDPALLTAIAFPLAAGGVVAAVYGFVLMALTATAPRPPQATPTSENRQQEKSQKRDIGRAFNLTHAIVFAAIVSTVLLLSAALHQWLGERGALIASAITGLADAHATAASAASLSAAEKISHATAVSIVLVGLSSNSLAKTVAALSGSAYFVCRVLPGLVLMLAAAWGAALLQG